MRAGRGKIRQLDSGEDLQDMFNGQDADKDGPLHSSADKESFSSMLEESLSGAGQAEIIRQKYPETDAPALQKKRSRRQDRPRAELDLHGCHVHEALLRVEAFIETSVLQGLDTVRIIVGKGLHSPGSAVLPDAVAKKITDLKRQGRVAACVREHKHKRFSGSLLVYLK